MKRRSGRPVPRVRLEQDLMLINAEARRVMAYSPAERRLWNEYVRAAQRVLATGDHAAVAHAARARLKHGVFWDRKVRSRLMRARRKQHKRIAIWREYRP